MRRSFVASESKYTPVVLSSGGEVFLNDRNVLIGFLQ